MGKGKKRRKKRGGEGKREGRGGGGQRRGKRKEKKRRRERMLALEKKKSPRGACAFSGLFCFHARAQYLGTNFRGSQKKWKRTAEARRSFFGWDLFLTQLLTIKH